MCMLSKLTCIQCNCVAVKTMTKYMSCLLLCATKMYVANFIPFGHHATNNFMYDLKLCDFPFLSLLSSFLFIAFGPIISMKFLFCLIEIAFLYLFYKWTKCIFFVQECTLDAPPTRSHLTITCLRHLLLVLSLLLAFYASNLIFIVICFLPILPID